MKPPVDQEARECALDPSKSVIIQAPAGSGKTGLLIRRFLMLLARVEEPEQILSITFTRKATAEMQRRVTGALQGVDDEGNPESDPELKKLAADALANDHKQGWNLVQNTRRLRIQTIDSLCSELVQRMPWSSRFGAAPTILEEAEEFYSEAANRTLAHLEDDDNNQLSKACSQVINLLDANLGAAIELIAGMLRKRDKWMRLLGGHQRALLESWWQQTIEDSLVRCNALMTDDMRQHLGELAPYAAQNIQTYNREKHKPTSRLEYCVSMQGFPKPAPDQLEYWQGITELLLLANGKGLRKAVNVQSGFPQSDADKKKNMSALLEALRENTALERALVWIHRLPGAYYSDDQWQSLDAILTLLPIAAAELKLLFSENNQADYIELSQRAELALGDQSAPTDLALIFDYQIRHILVDEFQDTSTGQLSLLEKLFEGWQSDDGRSAFFVGDPMQSIYRFREAEVANFLHTQTHGIGDVMPKSLLLRTNFRSDKKIVDWVNTVFFQVMPDRSDEINGAVSYAAADSFLTGQTGCKVEIHPSVDATPEMEASRLSNLVATLLKHHPKEKIAILGRTRSSLTEIARALNLCGIAFQGIKLQRLGERQAIQDLHALTCAIQQPADRVAWLGLMRAPWCGLSLSEMTHLFGDDRCQPVLMSLTNAPNLEKLSLDCQANMRRVVEVMERSRTRRGRVPLWKNLEATWIALGGPACVEPSDLDDCQRFISLVRELECDGVMINKSSLDSSIRELWASTNVDSLVQLLTIHAAKGLEFDTVIIPGLERRTRTNDPELLRFRSLPDRLLLAPKPASENREDPFYRYLGQLETEHLHNEATRLLYVACTRARRRLHLFGNVKSNQKGEISQPATMSFLALLWPSISATFENCHQQKGNISEVDAPADTFAECMVERLPAGWRLPALPKSIQILKTAPDTDSNPDSAIEFDWAGETARICGIVIHRVLQNVDRVGWERWRRKPASSETRNQWRANLIEAGISAYESDEALTLVESAVKNARADSQAEWIFSPKHQNIITEWPVTGVINNNIWHCVIDRSFIDENGTRWIIDFKSSRHEQQQDLAQFIVQEKERYRSTLERYAAIVKVLDPRPIRTALYYPVLQRFEEL
ncbi:MAG: UvrD-helicase domain-containing protein [Arenicellales bacterium]